MRAIAMKTLRDLHAQSLREGGNLTYTAHMVKGLTRRGFLRGATGASAMALLSVPAFANPPNTSLHPVSRPDDFLRRLQPTSEDLIAKAKLDGVVGFAVLNAATGEVLDTHAADTGLPPASVAKALTSGYALAYLGESHRFETRVLATGGVSEGVVQGDLILAGGGDPTLETDHLEALAKSLAEAGISGVQGAFKVWGGGLPFLDRIDAAQPDHVGYSPAVSGLNLNYNRVHFEWRRSGSAYAVTMDARSDRHRPDVHMARMVVEARQAPVYTYTDAGGRDDWTVARGALGDGGARWLPVRKPELYAGDVFQTFARAHGIALGAPQQVAALPDGALKLVTHESAPLTDILHDMLEYSTNLTAEVVGLSATAARIGRKPASLEESASELNKWAPKRLASRALDWWIIPASASRARSRRGR
jgi:D-alanyl-D-alanine carboxypeptidase/D-alanyl-D-alanine-endopeptidase (penicillin-binding protein 4)